MFSQAKCELQKVELQWARGNGNYPREGLMETNNLVNISRVDHQLAKAIGIE